jgi:hypothetical protein
MDPTYLGTNLNAPAEVGGQAGRLPAEARENAYYARHARPDRDISPVIVRMAEVLLRFLASVRRPQRGQFDK